MKQQAVIKPLDEEKIVSSSEELDPRKITMDLEAKIPSLSKMPEADRVRAVSIVMQKVEMLSGPLPPPIVLEHYNNVLAGAADRIITMAESTLAHDQTVQSKILDADIRASNRDHTYRTMSIVIAFFALFGMLLLVAWLAYIKQPLLAGLFGASSIGITVWNFIQGKTNDGSTSQPFPNPSSTKPRKIKKK
jgi:uncharacterized membrane protein